MAVRAEFESVQQAIRMEVAAFTAVADRLHPVQGSLALGYDKFDDARQDADLAALHGDAEFQALLKTGAAQ